MIRKPKKKKTSAVFAQLAECEENLWWCNFFEQLAEGIFPYRLSYINGSLSYPKGGKFIQLLVENQDLEELREQIKVYIKIEVGIIPDDEVEDFSTISSTADITWKTLLKDNTLRDILIYKYLNSLKLDKKEYERIHNEIWWGFLKREFTVANFEIVNKQIVNYYPNTIKKENKTKKEKKSITPQINPLKIKCKNDPRFITRWQVLYHLNKIGTKEVDD